ncbi:helix-turn-helix domain-containing protein [Vibrio coralliilyticus]|nr:helix-turn-helix domain-containing protein [Vibrio coralliilyticus]
MSHLNIRSETLLSYDAGWEQPLPDEIRNLIKVMNYSGADVGRLVGVSSRTVRKWVGGESPIPFSAWAILVEQATGEKIWATHS